MDCCTGLLMNCHMCGESYDHYGLRMHLTSEHGVHLFHCTLCSVLLNTSDPHDQQQSEAESAPSKVEFFDVAIDDLEPQPQKLRSLPRKVTKASRPELEVEGIPLGEVTFQCQTCNESLREISQLRDHIKETHTNLVFP